MRSLSIGLLALGLAGCGGASTVSLDATALTLAVTGPTDAMTRVRLDGATGVTTPPSGPVIRAFAPPSHDLAFTPGTLALGLSVQGDRAVIEGLELPLGSITVFAPSLPASGLTFRELVLRLERGVLPRLRATPDLLSLGGTLRFALDWKLELDDGTLYPLAPIGIGPIETHVAVTAADDGALTLQIMGLCPDGCGGVDGVFGLADGAFYARSDATAR
jgi:hypothetical protein